MAFVIPHSPLPYYFQSSLLLTSSDGIARLSYIYQLLYPAIMERVLTEVRTNGTICTAGIIVMVTALIFESEPSFNWSMLLHMHVKMASPWSVYTPSLSWCPNRNSYYKFLTHLGCINTIGRWVRNFLSINAAVTSIKDRMLRSMDLLQLSSEQLLQELLSPNSLRVMTNTMHFLKMPYPN